jgi:hypothetical protein
MIKKQAAANTQFVTTTFRPELVKVCSKVRTQPPWQCVALALTLRGTAVWVASETLAIQCGKCARAHSWL